MSGNFQVRYESDGERTRWVTRRHGNVVSIHSTQQSAIEFAKEHAREMRVDAIWEDRAGNEQGHARYRIGLF